MKFNKTLQQRYKKHLNIPLLNEKLDQKEIDRLLNVSKEIKEIMGTTPHKVDVLRYLFDLIMEETAECDKKATKGYEEDEINLTPGQANAINLAYNLAGGNTPGGAKARGGLASALTGGLVGDPVKKIQKSYGNILSALSKRLDEVAKNIETGGTP